MKFIVHNDVFDKLEDVCFGIVAAYGIDNKIKIDTISDLLDSNIESVRKRFENINIKECSEISPYREAFVKLGFNPNKFMCSIEALMKRILKGGEFPRINNVVDLANAVSLKYVIPLGAHDIDMAAHDIELRFSKESDSFLPFDGTETESVDPNELVYASGDNVKTRRWIWRQSDDGKITNESTNIFFPIDGFKHSNYDSVISSRDELAELVKKYFNCEVKIGFIDKYNTEMEL